MNTKALHDFLFFGLELATFDGIQTSWTLGSTLQDIVDECSNNLERTCTENLLSRLKESIVGLQTAQRHSSLSAGYS